MFVVILLYLRIRDLQDRKQKKAKSRSPPLCLLHVVLTRPILLPIPVLPPPPHHPQRQRCSPRRLLITPTARSLFHLFLLVHFLQSLFFSCSFLHSLALLYYFSTLSSPHAFHVSVFIYIDTWPLVSTNSNPKGAYFPATYFSQSSPRSLPSRQRVLREVFFILVRHASFQVSILLLISCSARVH